MTIIVLHVLRCLVKCSGLIWGFLDEASQGGLRRVFGFYRALAGCQTSPFKPQAMEMGYQKMSPEYRPEITGSSNVVARLMDPPPPPPPPTKTFGLNNLEPGAPLGGLAQDVGNYL